MCQFCNRLFRSLIALSLFDALGSLILFLLPVFFFTIFFLLLFPFFFLFHRLSSRALVNKCTRRARQQLPSLGSLVGCRILEIVCGVIALRCFTLDAQVSLLSVCVQFSSTLLRRVCHTRSCSHVRHSIDPRQTHSVPRNIILAIVSLASKNQLPTTDNEKL